jgi:hypothetical protein
LLWGEPGCGVNLAVWCRGWGSRVGGFFFALAGRLRHLKEDCEREHDKKANRPEIVQLLKPSRHNRVAASCESGLFGIFP